MTHTLHPEIEKRIKSCAKNIVWLKEYPLEDGCVEIIKFHLLPYLKMPQPIENEPLPEKQSTPQIEKIERASFVKNKSEDNHWDIIAAMGDKINELVDYINNTLPTNRS